MKIRRSSQFAGLAVFALLLLPAAFGADEEQKPERGSVEFGVRYVWGDVYGRPDLQLGPGGPAASGNPAVAPGCLGCGTGFDPLLRTSKYEEYRDLRNGFFIRRFNATFDNVLNSKNYVSLQSQKTLYRDQGYLATFGQYGKFKVQFRYDEIPHVYTDTARTLFTQTTPGVWSFPSAVRSTIQASSAANLPSLLAGTGANAANGVVTSFNFLTPSIIRKAGTALVSYNLTPDLNIFGSFMRESQNGFRPIGLIMNSSPSASATSGFGVELPETISYFNNLVRVGAEYGKHDWGVQAAYIGSFFQQNIPDMVWDNPFRLNQTGLTPAQAVSNPTSGRMTLYPNNHADYLNVAGAADLGKWVRVMASISPGWLRQDEAFFPYTTNDAITGCGGVAGASCTTTASLPAASLGGNKQTLAMNYTLVTLPWKQFQIKATYRHYDYNNNTPVRTFTPVEGDAAAPVAGGVENTPFGYNRKTLNVTGNWFFLKRSSAKVGYEAEWMDRSHRDVEHSMENSVFGAVDVNYWKNLLVRLSYRHSDRKPDVYQDDTVTDAAGNPVLCSDTTTTFFTGDQRCARRFDESHRIRNRADGLVQYSFTDKFSVSAFGGGIQDDYNQAGGTNSPTPLNFLTGSAATTSPYFLYGILKDISYNYGVGGDYAVSPQLTLFAEYSHEHYYRRLISRDRAPTSGAQTILTCTGCDSANNDWESTTPELVDIWTAGADTYFNKKIYFSTYYSLSAARANTFSRFLGDPTITTGANAFILNGASAATNYPESVNRLHEVVAVFKYKLTKNLMPKFEFRYQQFD
ncbi:MAG: MtrB/PioB family outer membrane beta-barrel protein, partial [Terriglobales bacterium]